ncbi:DUF2807 domain-containing protein [Caulobacter vibrioides]|uniref:DUF2807 domain-containing protein n=1 Tax=Caulobacter vibrioides TaxID=155892 RepID=A0A290MPI8_CAUVI|nr:DUF2807 domain-containing protein [Caulobacter vibrioides]ATC33931.1 DUF2807 domain-containing protein [Caulobacter vibrioides]
MSGEEGTMMIRNTLIVAGASFALAVGCFAGVAAIAGPELMTNGWTIPFGNEANVTITDDNGKVVRTVRHVGAGGAPSPMVDRTLPWAGKDTLTIDLPVDVVFVQGAEAKIVVSGPKSYVDRLKIAGGRISLDDINLAERAVVTLGPDGLQVRHDRDRMKITVVAPDVTRFEVRGSGDLDIRRYEHPALGLDISGSGDVEAEGKVETITLDNSGSGYADLAALKAKDATIDVSGSGGGAVFATDKAKIDISGSGDVELRTEPKLVTSEITGSGDIRREY